MASLRRYAPLEIAGNQTDTGDNAPMTTYYTTLDTPLKTLTLLSDGTALTGIYLSEHKDATPRGTDWQNRDANIS